MIRFFRKSTIPYMALAAVLTACSDSETTSPTPAPGELAGDMIAFSVSDGNVAGGTRSDVVRSHDDMWDHNIGVRAVLPTGNDYFPNEILSYQGEKEINMEDGSDKGAWSTSVKYYWPLDNLSFYALMPYDENRIPASSFTCTVPKDNSGQVGLMYALALNQSKTAGTVRLNFKQAMSLLNFYAKAANGLSVTVSGIDLCNVMTKGTFTFPQQSTLEQGDGSENPDDEHHCKWTDLTDNGTLSAGIAETALSTETQNVTAEGGQMTVIPQTLTAWDRGTDDDPRPISSTGSYLAIHCRLMSAGLYFAGTDTTFGTVYVPFSGTFEAGKEYTVTLNFGMGYTEDGIENKIKIAVNTASITDWTSEVINYEGKIL